MGSLIYLTVGNLEMDWGKNDIINDHSSLFRPSDVTLIPYRYVDESGNPIVEMKEGYSSPLKTVLKRIALLGYTADSARQEFDKMVRILDLSPPFTFDGLEAALMEVDVEAVSPNYFEDDGLGSFFRSEIYHRLQIGKFSKDPRKHLFGIDQVMENLHSYELLCLLGKNPANLEQPVNWSYADVVEGGWIDHDFFRQELSPSSKFLIVTEGSSDAKIIRHGLDILRPEIADFFSFVDMEAGYPFSGAGSMVNFCKGLASIGLLNNTLLVFDNDAEGDQKYQEVKSLSLPANIVAVRLPNQSEFEKFPTIGPSGDGLESINARAASIECYLDHSWKMERDPVVRWTSYNRVLKRYQGELESKEVYARRFLGLRKPDQRYNFRRLEAVLDMIVESCISMAAAVTTGSD